LGRVLIPPCFRVLQRYWRPQLAPGDPYRPGLVARAWPGSLASRAENCALAEAAWPRITATLAECPTTKDGGHSLSVDARVPVNTAGGGYAEGSVQVPPEDPLPRDAPQRFRVRIQ
jgi:hypothetical protein